MNTKHGCNGGTITSGRKTLTVRDTLAAIRSLGCTARRTDGEWRVRMPDGGTYFTDDAADAIATARYMAERLAEIRHESDDRRALQLAAI